jgi:hypothetical protein
MSRAIQRAATFGRPPLVPVFESVIDSWHHLRIPRLGSEIHRKA